MPKLEIEQKLELMKAILSRHPDPMDTGGMDHVYKDALELLEQEESDAD